jgi:hypothetical protein
MKRPENVNLSREEGEALLARLDANTLTAEDRRVLGKVLTFHFWLVFALREAKVSLKRLKVLVFGEKWKRREPPLAGGPSGARGGSVGAVLPGGAMVSARELPGVGRRPCARCHAVGSSGARGQLRLSGIRSAFM